MPDLDLEKLLALLKDPHSESQAIAALAGVPREEAGRAARLLMALPKAKPEEVLTLPGPLAAAFARAAFAASRVDLLLALCGHAAKEVAKEAKRSLHLLRIRGVDVPEAPRPAAPAPFSLPKEPPLPALSSGVDGRGEHAIWLPRSLPGRGVEVAQAVLSDEKGILELKVGVLGRKDWRTFAKEITSQAKESGVVAMPQETAHALIAEARARNEESGQRVPDGTDLWMNQLGPALPPPAPGSSLPKLPEAEERVALSRSDRLHAMPGFDSFIASTDFLQRVAAKLEEVEVSPLYIDERQRTSQAEHVLDEAVEEYLDAKARKRLAHRLLAAADHLLALGVPDGANSAAATSRALESGLPGRDIPFARPLVSKAFAKRAPPAKAESPEPSPPASPLILSSR